MKWTNIKIFKDIKLEKSIIAPLGIIKITINRPKVRNAFRPQTVFELKEAFTLAREDQTCGVIILTGEGELAFCSGGDQTIRGDAGYVGNVMFHSIVDTNSEITCPAGDLNLDGIVNVVDIIGMVNSVLGAIQLTDDQTCSADMNDDGIVNVLDITIVVNIILNG